ncbi:MAG TPA: Rrf2 family transcriptional regulator [Bryobacteraceae bacterium]|nr:Rrf2 family transcriptional regulator [Bryobacteraceae bacterium]
MFSTTCEYALRALVRLAQMPDGSAVLGRDLAQHAEIPANYLSKILLTLRNAGILTTARGTGGGYRLRKTPEEIRLIHIVELFDGARARPACLLGGHDCSDENPCSAHHVWRDVRAVYVRFLESTTLADISQPVEALAPSDEQVLANQ